MRMAANEPHWNWMNLLVVESTLALGDTATLGACRPTVRQSESTFGIKHVER